MESLGKRSVLLLSIKPHLFFLKRTYLLCVYQGFEVLPYSITLLTTVRVLQAIIYCILSLFRACLNILVIILVARYKKLQTHSFGIALQIAVVNVQGSVFNLSGAVSSMANRWVLGEPLCILNAMLLFIYTNVRTSLSLSLCHSHTQSITVRL